MRINKRMLIIAAAGTLVGLTGCGSSATTAGSPGSGANSTASDTASPTSAPSTSPGSGAAPSTSAPQAADPVLITIKDFKYTIPASVAPGAKIMVKNADGQNHTVTSSPAGAFDVTVDGGGGTVTFTAPTKPGSYMFVCTFHADMTGTLAVK